jgi:histidinol-phosphate aminotransferase
LCSAIARSLDISSDMIFCANSSDEVLALAFQAFFSGKDNIVTPDVSYGFYPVWGEMYDAGLKFAALREDFTVDTDDYTNSNGIIIANPNAPTGIALGLSDIEKIIKQNPNGAVIIDEAYIDFARSESALKLTASYDNLLVVRTCSKSYSLAGLRVGYALGNPALIDGLRRVRNAFNSYPLGMLAQICAAAAVSDTAYLSETVSRIIKTRDFTVGELEKLGYNVLDSQANFIFMHAENAKALYEHLMENKILVRYWEKPRINQFLRVSIGTDKDMEAFIECVSRF